MWISIFGVCIQIICSLEVALGAVAMIACFESSAPRGLGKFPQILLTGTTSGVFLLEVVVGDLLVVGFDQLIEHAPVGRP